MPTDADRLARARAGDRAAFEAVVSRYGPLVHGIALARTTRPDAAADLVRRTFARLWSDLGREEGDTAAADAEPLGKRLPALLHREIEARGGDSGDRSLQMLRIDPSKAGSKGRPLVLEEVLGDLPDADSARVVLEVLGRMPGPQVAPLVLRWVQGLDYGAIGELLGQDVAAVRHDLAEAERLFERELRHVIELAAR